MNSIVINRSVSYRKSGEVYVFYYDFDYFFFRGQAAKLMDQLLELLKKNGNLESIPDSFLQYLKSKKIIEEAPPCTVLLEKNC